MPAAHVPARKPVIGLSGGIGSGKSAVAEAFAGLGCLVIDSDSLNRDVLMQPEVQNELREWWGADVVRPDSSPDRRRIAEIVFGDAEQKRRLEELTHPLIAQRRAAIMQCAERDSAVKAIVFDSPLLFESNLTEECDAIVFVQASELRRRERLRLSRHWDETELRRREQWQLPLAYKRARADFVIDNDGPPEALAPQVAVILREILNAPRSGSLGGREFLGGRVSSGGRESSGGHESSAE